MRIVFTSVGGHGHFRPMAPLAQALRGAHHDVVIATMERLRPTVEDLGLEILPVGIPNPEAMRRLHAAHPDFRSLSTEEESRRIVTDFFVGILTPSITGWTRGGVVILAPAQPPEGFCAPARRVHRPRRVTQ